MDLEGGNGRQLERIADRVAVVRPGAWIEQEAVGQSWRVVQTFHVLALGVGLEEARLEPELPRPVADPHLELDQREGAVVLGVALAEHVEIDTVQNLDAVAHADHVPDRSSSIASTSASSATSTCVTTSPGARRRTRFRRSPLRFLSRPACSSR